MCAALANQPQARVGIDPGGGPEDDRARGGSPSVDDQSETFVLASYGVADTAPTPDAYAIGRGWRLTRLFLLNRIQIGLQCGEIANSQ